MEKNAGTLQPDNCVSPMSARRLIPIESDQQLLNESF